MFLQKNSQTDDSNYYNFPQGKEKFKFPNSNPFIEDDVDKSEVASVAYR